MQFGNKQDSFILPKNKRQAVAIDKTLGLPRHPQPGDDIAYYIKRSNQEEPKRIDWVTYNEVLTTSTHPTLKKVKDTEKTIDLIIDTVNYLITKTKDD